MKSLAKNTELRIGAKQHKSIFKKMLQCWQLYVFLIPGILVMIIFKYIPMYGIQLAFKDFIPGKAFSEMPWVGFEHFIRFFTMPESLRVIWNTVKISVLDLVLTFPLPIIFALMLDELRNKRAKKLVQNLTYLPHLFSVVVVMTVTSILLAPNTGLINIIIGKLGGEQVLFYGDDKYVLPIYIITGIWASLGASAILYLSALTSIDQEQIEAAKIDGASRFRIILNIKLPAIANTIVIMLIMGAGSMFSLGADKMLLMQTGLNLGASEIISTYTYKMGLINGDFAFSTAVSLFNNLANITCLLIVNTIANKVSDNSII
jgi:putative aldouronate transport system permease protein